MTTTALNRALLARQGLVERLDLPLVDAVEAVGALQAQYWPAPPAALWSRVEGFEPEALYAALGARARPPARAQVAPVPALVGLRACPGRRLLGNEGAQRPARRLAPARRAEGRHGARRGRAPPPAGVRARRPRRRGGLDRMAHAAGARGLRAPRGRARAPRGRGRPRALRPARRAAAPPR